MSVKSAETAIVKAIKESPGHCPKKPCLLQKNCAGWERTMVIHIIHTAPCNEGIRSWVQLGKRGPKHHIGTGAAKAATLTIDESTDC